MFFFHELSPGSCFFLPKGAHIYNTLIEFIKTEYRRRGFQEVVSPNIFNSKLWVTSGHWDHYSVSMYSNFNNLFVYIFSPSIVVISFFCLSVDLFVCLLFVCLFVFLFFVCLLVVCLFVICCLFVVYLFVVYLFICCLFICLLFTFCLFVVCFRRTCFNLILRKRFLPLNQ